jgi:Sec-independent protein secretion pathway component TatC
VSLAIPMLALYEASILIGGLIEKKRAEAEAAEDKAD